MVFMGLYNIIRETTNVCVCVFLHMFMELGLSGEKYVGIAFTIWSQNLLCWLITGKYIYPIWNCASFLFLLGPTNIVFLCVPAEINIDVQSM